MSKLDDIRAEIVNRIEAAKMVVAEGQRTLDLACRELDAHDRAVALFVEPPKAKRSARRDVARLVVEALTDEPQHISKIAAAVGIAPSRVLHTLERTAHARRAEGTDGWVRGDGDHP
jgi:hypothetical protein